MKLIYIAYGNVSVFDSQVVALLNYYIETNLVEELILVIGIKSNRDKDKYLNKGINKNIRLLFYYHFPQYPLIELLTIISLLNVLKKIDDLEKFIIHVRNDVLAFYAYKALEKLNNDTEKLIADVRGAGFDQIQEYSNYNKLKLKLKFVQRENVFNTLNKIKNISVVSESLKKYVITRNNGKSQIISINSCLAGKNFKFNNTERYETRNELGLKGNDILFVLSTGGDDKWQNTNETISFIIKKGFKVLNLSKNKIESSSVINLFVEYNEVPKYLSAADLAIIWRKSSITNKVASPVKFSEYVCCGLPVITNNSIDLIANFIQQNACGVVINYFEEIDENLIEALLKLDRAKISNIGNGYFSIEKIASQYVYIYNIIGK